MGLLKLGGLPPLKENFPRESKLLSTWWLGLLYFIIHNYPGMQPFRPYGSIFSSIRLCHSTWVGVWFYSRWLEQKFPHGRAIYKHKFVELPLILRGHSLGQSKDFGSLSQLDLLMSLAIFHLAVVFLEGGHHAKSNETLMVGNIFLGFVLTEVQYVSATLA